MHETPASLWLVGGAPKEDLLSLAISGEFAAKFSGLELYHLVTSSVGLICGRSLRLSAGDSML
jgi:hypothetical protein